MIVSIHFDLNDELHSDFNVRTIKEYDNCLLEEFGLQVIDVCDVYYRVTDASKFSIFLLKYPESIIDIKHE
jgi:hypothetical protein